MKILNDRLLNIFMWVAGIAALVLIAAPDNSLAYKISSVVSIIAFFLFFIRLFFIMWESRKNKRAGNQKTKSTEISNKAFVIDGVFGIIWFFLLVLLSKPTKPYLTYIGLGVVVIMIIVMILWYYRIKKLHRKKP